jgi:photosystem II stability/assembly factor-like uncharacterized protein
VSTFRVRSAITAGVVVTAATAVMAFARIQAGVTRVEQVSNTTALLIAVSAVSEDVVWAVGQRGTYVRTTDGGATWKAAQVPGAESLQFRDVYAVDADTAYLLSIGNGADSRIYKTANAGATWTKQFQNADSAAFFDCFDFWDSERGIAISDAVNGRMVMIQTVDGGAHWTPVTPSSLPQALPGEGSFASSGTCLVTRPGGHAWVGTTKSRVLHTSDYGRTWSITKVPITTSDTTGVSSLSFRDARRGIAFGGFGARPADILIAITNDGGQTWEDRRRPPFRGGMWVGAYVPGPRSTMIVAAGVTGSAYSLNEGATWVPIDTLPVWGMDIVSPSAGWMVGPRGRIARLRFPGQ